ncbi:hypothetical protein COBT_001930, partial [Conglomerata obtusa]
MPWSIGTVEVANSDFVNTDGAHNIHFENNFGLSKTSDFSKLSANNTALPYTNRRSKDEL